MNKEEPGGLQCIVLQRAGHESEGFLAQDVHVICLYKNIVLPYITYCITKTNDG